MKMGRKILKGNNYVGNHKQVQSWCITIIPETGESKNDPARNLFTLPAVPTFHDGTVHICVGVKGMLQE